MSYAEAAARLKRLHTDPFDHMLVAQAIDENLVLLTRDAGLKPYGSHVLCV
jgi:PIN domain nuclease of toxin-antitoxin system